MDVVGNSYQTVNNLDSNPYQVLVDTIKNPFEIKEINQNYKLDEQKQCELLSSELDNSNVPSFFKQEKNLYLFKTLFFLIFLIVSIGLLGFFIWSNYHKHTNHIANYFNYGYYILVGILIFFSSLFLVINTIQFHFLNKEYKLAKISFDSNNVSTTIQSIYKKLIVSFINTNWFCAYIYLTCGFIILFIFIVTYFVAIWYLGGINAPSFGSLYDWSKIATTNGEIINYGIYPRLNKISVIVICCICGTTLIFQVLSQIINLIRVKRIETTYVNKILSEEEIIALKHSANKRNFIIFAILTIFFGLILLILYLLLKRKK